MKEKIDKYIRDKNNPGAVYNTDNNALNQYKLIKKKQKKETELVDDVEKLKGEFAEIREMLELIIKKI
jgi:hypothetical protein